MDSLYNSLYNRTKIDVESRHKFQGDVQHLMLSAGRTKKQDFQGILLMCCNKIETKLREIIIAEFSCFLRSHM